MNFDKISLLIFALMGLTAALSAQQVYTVKADSTKLTGCDSNELIIENHTQNVKGFLFNKGNGRTIFQKGAIKIDGSAYLIGSDTLRIGGGLTDSGTFYVHKRYTGMARVFIAGFTLASVSSTNPSYNSQLSKAVPGNILSCYPDPYSARNAALDALAAGRIKHAQIVILEGNQYTIGSKDSSRNGSIDGLHANNGTIADIQFDSAALAADNSLSSIMKHNVDMYFSMGTNLTYINSAFPIYCVYLSDTTNNTYFKSNTYGVGTFYQVYGQGHFPACFYQIANRNSYTSFHAREMILQQYNGFYMRSFSFADIDVEDLFSSETDAFSVGIGNRFNGPWLGNASNAPQMAHVRVKNWKYGNNQIPYPTFNDGWYAIGLGENPYQEGTIVTIDIGNMYMVSTDYSPLFFVGTSAAQYGVRMTVNIDNLVQKDAHFRYFPAGKGGLLGFYGTGTAVNSSITYNIKSARIEAPLLGFMNFCGYAGSKNNRFNINVGDLQKDSSAFPGGLFNLTSDFTKVSEPALISVSGDFKSYDTKPMLYLTGTVPLSNKYVFSGTYYMAHSGQPVARFFKNAGKIVALKDAVLINDGTTALLAADSTGTPVYLKNVHGNSAGAMPTIQSIGDTGVILSDVSDFFKW